MMIDHDRPEWFAPAELPPQYVGVLQGIFASCLQGLQRDLLRAEKLLDPYAARREWSALTRLLSGLERGEISGPDEAACVVLRQLATTADEANDYASVIIEHDALHGLLDRLDRR